MHNKLYNHYLEHHNLLNHLIIPGISIQIAASDWISEHITISKNMINETITVKFLLPIEQNYGLDYIVFIYLYYC